MRSCRGGGIAWNLGDLDWQVKDRIPKMWVQWREKRR